MRYRELLVEMAFTRKRIIRALESYDARIFEHATKIIIMPDAQDVAHWKREILAWAGYLASLRLKTNTKKNPPMGFSLAYKYLYEDPFEGNEIGMTAHFVRLAAVTYDLSDDIDVERVHQKLKTFLTALAHNIGEGTDVTWTIAQL